MLKCTCGNEQLVKIGDNYYKCDSCGIICYVNFKGEVHFLHEVTPTGIYMKMKTDPLTK